MRIPLLTTAAALCLALPPAYARVDGLPCECPRSPAGPNPALKIIDADLGKRLGDSGCDLAEKKTTFELRENVQLRLVVSGARPVGPSDAQIVVKWTDPNGEVIASPRLCLEPSDTYRTCARKNAFPAGEWRVTVTDCAGSELIAPLKFRVTP